MALQACGVHSIASDTVLSAPAAELCLIFFAGKLVSLVCHVLDLSLRKAFGLGHDVAGLDFLQAGHNVHIAATHRKRRRGHLHHGA